MEKYVNYSLLLLLTVAAGPIVIDLQNDQII